LLFFANFVAIQFSYSLVFWLNGYHRLTLDFHKDSGLLFRNALSLGLLIFLSVFLGVNLRSSVKERLFEIKIRESLQQDLKNFPGTNLVGLSVSRDDNAKIIILADVRTPYSISPESVQRFEFKLPPAKIPVELHIRSILTKEASARGWLHLENITK